MLNWPRMTLILSVYVRESEEKIDPHLRTPISEHGEKIGRSARKSR